MRYLTSAGELLRLGKSDRIRLYPLVLREPIETLVERRKRLFDVLTVDRKAHGLEIGFKRTLTRSTEDRVCAGPFRILEVNEHLAIVESSLGKEDNDAGPARLTAKAYPLARWPFFPSTTLTRLLDQLGRKFDSKPITRKTLGYHRRSRSFRLDYESQPPDLAAREMAEQDRFPHRMSVIFSQGKRERARLTFDRNARLTILEGDPVTLVTHLMLPGIQESISTDKLFQVRRTRDALRQEAVELQFANDPFDSYGAMNDLCDAVRQSDGLNLAIIHLNPYLHAQVLDFFTGAAIDLVITDRRRISLVPRSGDCASAIQRIATTIYYHFGEGQTVRNRIFEQT